MTKPASPIIFCILWENASLSFINYIVSCTPSRIATQHVQFLPLKANSLVSHKKVPECFLRLACFSNYFSSIHWLSMNWIDEELLKDPFKSFCIMIKLCSKRLMSNTFTPLKVAVITQCIHKHTVTHTMSNSARRQNTQFCRSAFFSPK